MEQTDPRVDEYLAAQPEPHRLALAALRRRLHEQEPDLAETISYGCPAFMLRGKKVAGFAGFAKLLAFFPHSGSVMDGLADRLAGLKWSKGAVQFGLDAPLPDELLRALLDARIAEL